MKDWIFFAKLKNIQAQIREITDYLISVLPPKTKESKKIQKNIIDRRIGIEKDKVYNKKVMR